MPLVPVCDGTITEDINGVITCSEAWQFRTYEAVVAFDPALDLDPVLIAGAVGTGFFILVPIWAAGLGVRKLLSMIR